MRGLYWHKTHYDIIMTKFAGNSFLRKTCFDKYLLQNWWCPAVSVVSQNLSYLVVGVLVALSWCVCRILLGSPGFGNVLGGSVEFLAGPASGVFVGLKEHLVEYNLQFDII